MNIMVVGVGGQGTLLTSRIIGKTALAAGYDVKLSEVHGMAQRGGSVVTFVRYGERVFEPVVEAGLNNGEILRSHRIEIAHKIRLIPFPDETSASEIAVCSRSQSYIWNMSPVG